MQQDQLVVNIEFNESDFTKKKAKMLLLLLFLECFVNYDRVLMHQTWNLADLKLTFTLGFYPFMLITELPTRSDLFKLLLKLNWLKKI